MKKGIVFLLFFTAFLIISCSNDNDPADSSLTADSVITEMPDLDEFGITADSFDVFEGEVKRNETLADLLLPHNVSYVTITNAALTAKDTFDVRKIKSGNRYKIYSKTDSLERINYFVYEENPLNYVVFDFTDSLISVSKSKKEVTVRSREMAAEITSSLYESILEQGVHPLLALEMSEVLAWQIDFYRIRKGDKFSVIFEEEYVDGEFFRISKINAVNFTHMGENYYGFAFDTEDGTEYYDENGKSLRKAFLKAPLKFSRISSGYTHSRLHPVLKIRRPHLGTDYAAPRGTPIRSIGDGEVILRTYTKGAGNFIKIKHNGTYTSGYMHLSKFAKGITVGKRVRQGDIIGYVGSTGLSTGPHLDLRFYKNGQPVNYLNQKFPPAHPIDEKYTLDYNAQKDSLLIRLESVSILLKEKTDSTGTIFEDGVTSTP